MSYHMESNKETASLTAVEKHRHFVSSDCLLAEENRIIDQQTPPPPKKEEKKTFNREICQFTCALIQLQTAQICANISSGPVKQYIN